MATLKDLCSTIPESIMREQAIRELNRRKALSYAQRLGALAQETRVFEACVQRRPTKGKAKNRFSREEAGTIGNVVVGIRTGHYSVCVCKTQNKW